MVWLLHFQRLFCLMLHDCLLLFLFMNIFMAIIALKQCVISSTTELSFIFADVIWWTESRMAFALTWSLDGLISLLQECQLLKCIIHKVTTSWHIGWCWAHQSLFFLLLFKMEKSVFCLLFNWGYVDCSVGSSILGWCMGVLTCTYFIHNKVFSISVYFSIQTLVFYLDQFESRYLHYS